MKRTLRTHGSQLEFAGDRRYQRRVRGARSGPTGWLHAAALTIALPTGAAAESPQQRGPAAIQFAAPPECPSGEDFVRAVESRSVPRAQTADGRTFVVRLELVKTGARGSLRIFGPHEHGVERVFHADDCSELADALAFVIATLMTPEADEVHAPERRPVPPATKSAALSPPARARFRLGGGTSLGLYTGLSPELLSVQRLGLRIERTRADDRRDVWAAQLSVARGTSGRLRGRLGDAELTFMAARGDLCGPSWGTPVRVSACGLLDIGQLTGVGFAQYDSATKNSLWLSPGLLGRAELRLADALCLIADIGAAVPLIRPRFFFAARDEEETVHDVPFLSAFGALGVSALLP